MRLRKISIKNFRSIQKANVIIDGHSALVGENNAGKSAILRALNAFFNFDSEREDFVNGLHQYSSQASARIELTFTDIPERQSYIDKLSNGELVIRMTYKHSNNKRTIHYKKNGKYHEISSDFIDSVLSGDISFVFIPPNRDQKHIIWSENALLKKVLVEYLKQHTSKRDLLTPKVIDATKTIEKTFAKVALNIAKYYSLKHNFSFEISYEHLDYSILLNNISLLISDHGKKFSITECGSGIQSLTIIALYRYLACLKHNNFILGIEEPETNLHPQAQREFVKLMKQTDSNNNCITGEIQIIFTTHSSVIVDQMEHEEIVLFKKIPDNLRGFKTTVHQLPTNFWESCNLEEFKYYQFYKYRNSEFFFAKFIIIVESKTDAEVVRFLLKQKNIDIDLYGVCIINLEGIQSLKYPYYLLKHLDLPYFIILDKDFFIPYKNDELKASRSDSGFPQYRYEYKSSSLIEELIPNQKNREKLLTLFKNNHKEALDILHRYKIICFKYMLEIDLLSSKKAVSEFYSTLQVPVEEQQTQTLLIKKADKIKKPNVLLEVLKNTPLNNLPYSYKKIVSSLTEQILK